MSVAPSKLRNRPNIFLYKELRDTTPLLLSSLNQKSNDKEINSISVSLYKYNKIIIIRNNLLDLNEINKYEKHFR